MAPGTHSPSHRTAGYSLGETIGTASAVCRRPPPTMAAVEVVVVAAVVAAIAVAVPAAEAAKSSVKRLVKHSVKRSERLVGAKVVVAAVDGS